MKKLSRIGIMTLTATTLLTIGTPAFSSAVSAATVNEVSKERNSETTQTFIIPHNNANISSGATITINQQELSKDIAQSSTITDKNGVRTLEISDAGLLSIINKAYGTEFSTELVRRRHHSGITRVRYYGHGNVNIYLSKSMMNKLRADGYSAAFGIVMALISAAAGVPSMGVASMAISYVTKKLVGKMLAEVRPYKAGRVYKIRSWRYAGWRYQ